MRTDPAVTAEGAERRDSPSSAGGLRRRWLRFALGVLILAGSFWFLTTRPMPPGVAGAIIDHNLLQDVEATALFYTELERMPAIEERLTTRRATAAADR